MLQMQERNPPARPVRVYHTIQATESLWKGQVTYSIRLNIYTVLPHEDEPADRMRKTRKTRTGVMIQSIPPHL